MTETEATDNILAGDVKRPKGTRDFMPQDMLLRRRVEAVVRGTFESFGFAEIQTPTFETLALFQVRSGEKFREDIFRFVNPTKDSGEEATVEFCLRPELTAPTCRFFVSGDLGATTKPMKAYYMGSCFRYDKPAPGRYREFFQAGVELFGSSSVKADAEVVTVAATVLKRLGIPSFRIQLNDLAVLRTFLGELGLGDEGQAKVLSLVDNAGSDLAKCRLGALGPEVTETDIIREYEVGLRVWLPNEVIPLMMDLLELRGGVEVVGKAKDLFKDYPLTLAALEQSGANTIFTYLEASGVTDVVLDFSIARGLDYYTGLVFEVDVDELGGQKQVCGGGRYDRLVAEYGGHDTPATGFAFGLDRLVQCVELFQTSTMPSELDQARSDVLVKLLTDDVALEAQLTLGLREAGLRVEDDLMDRKMGKAFAAASKMGIPFVVVLGKREVSQGQVSVKNMVTGTQELVPLDADRLGQYLLKGLVDMRMGTSKTPAT